MSLPQPGAARLALRPLDAHNLSQFYELVRDEHILRFLLDGQHKSPEWCRGVMESSRREAERSGLGMWLLHANEHSEPLGFAGFLGLDGPTSPLELIYALRAEHTGHGYAREIAASLVDFAREHCGQGDITAAVDEPNGASSQVLTRLGSPAPAAFQVCSAACCSTA